jgi:hypothetical protein
MSLKSIRHNPGVGMLPIVLNRYAVGDAEPSARTRRSRPNPEWSLAIIPS